MELIPLLFLWGCIATIAFAIRTLDWNTMFLSVVLMVVCCASNIGWQFDALGLFPIMDLAVAYLGLQLWAWDRGSAWKLIFLVLAVAQLVLHLVYAVFGYDFELSYLALLNITFGLQLLAVSSRGIGNVGSDLLGWVRRLRAARRSPSRREIARG